MSNKAALIILDGWGIGNKSTSDAIYSARTPVFDDLLKGFPNATLKTFGEYVGLPTGQMGNSEVGHLNIGAGRIVYQDFALINKAVAENTLKDNLALQTAIQHTEESGKAFHLMGLVSDGGVHSHEDHLLALIDILERTSIKEIYIHAFTDGRDTDPKSGRDSIQKLLNHLEGKRTKLVSMIGRYYVMDRDKRWDRIKRAYDLLVHGEAEETSDFVNQAQKSYNQGVTDEFFNPVVIQDRIGRIQENDTVLCFNFRTDRCREITTVLTQESMHEFNMHVMPLHYVTMTRYDESFNGVGVMFEKDNLVNTLGEVVSKAGLTQLRMAETEKYPHVTFFFSGGRERPFSGEHREVVASPKVATYDLKPEMSAHEVAEKAVSLIQTESPDFICLNFANPDMVGHTGVYDAIIKAVETTDACLGKVVEAARSKGYELIVIADHGNADQTSNEDGSPHTAHTTNLVPIIYVGNTFSEVNDGILADVAPSLISIMSVSQPSEMTGSSLLK